MKINTNPTNSRIHWVRISSIKILIPGRKIISGGFFTPQDANLSLSIRLPNYYEDDYIPWQPEKNGLFTVRSAYKLAMDEKKPEMIVSSHNTSGTVVFGILFEKLMSPKSVYFHLETSN